MINKEKSAKIMAASILALTAAVILPGVKTQAKESYPSVISDVTKVPAGVNVYFSAGETSPRVPYNWILLDSDARIEDEKAVFLVSKNVVNDSEAPIYEDGKMWSGSKGEAWCKNFYGTLNEIEQNSLISPVDSSDTIDEPILFLSEEEYDQYKSIINKKTNLIPYSTETRTWSGENPQYIDTNGNIEKGSTAKALYPRPAVNIQADSIAYAISDSISSQNSSPDLSTKKVNANPTEVTQWRLGLKNDCTTEIISASAVNKKLSVTYRYGLADETAYTQNQDKAVVYIQNKDTNEIEYFSYVQDLDPHIREMTQKTVEVTLPSDFDSEKSSIYLTTVVSKMETQSGDVRGKSELVGSPAEISLSSENKITRISLNEFSVFKKDPDTTINFTVPADSDISKVTPDIELSADAVVSPKSGETQDFSNGKVVTYTVTAQDGSTKEYKVTVNKETKKYKITKTFDGTGGKVTARDVQEPDNMVTVDEGATVVYDITPDEGYVLGSLLLDSTPQETNVTSFTIPNITKDHSIFVSFQKKEKEEFTIKASAGEGGTISQTGDIVLKKGSKQTFTFTADKGYQIGNVYVDDAAKGAINGYVFENIVDDHKIRVEFVKTNVKMHSIKVTASEGGTVTPNGEVSVEDGKNQAFTIIPSENKKISSVKVDGKDAGALKSYTFSKVTEDHTIEVTFLNSDGSAADASGSDTNTSAAAKTGDYISAAGWIILLAVSTVSITAIMMIRRKRR